MKNPDMRTSLWWAVSVLFIVNVVASIDRTALSVMLPQIKSEMHLSDTQLGLLTGLAFSAFYALFGLPLARIADRGRRPLLIGIAMSFWSLATALTGLAQGFWHLMTARMLVAVGEAGGVPPAHSLISELAPEHRRPLALAIHSAGAPVGALIGLAGGGILVGAIGWRMSFVVLGLIGLPAAILVLTTLPEPRSKQPLSERVTNGDPSALLKRRSFQLLMAGFALGAFAMSGLLQWLPSYFSRAFSMAPAAIGIQFGLSYGLGATSGMLVGGLISSSLMRRDTRWALRLAYMSYMAAFFPLLGVLLVGDPQIAMVLVFVGTAFASMAYGPAYAMIQTIAPPNLRGFASAFSLFVANFIGAGFGPLAVGLLSDLHGGDPTPSLRYALLAIFPILIMPSALYALALRAFSREMVDPLTSKPVDAF